MKGEVIIDLVEYVISLVKSFDENNLHRTKVKMLWNDHLFKVRGIIPSLPESVAEKFHTFTAQRLFFCKRERRNIILKLLI